MTIMVTPTILGMPTVTSPRSRRRAELSLTAERLRAPAGKANIARNARAQIGRYARWAPAPARPALIAGVESSTLIRPTITTSPTAPAKCGANGEVQRAGHGCGERPV